MDKFDAFPGWKFRPSEGRKLTTRTLLTVFDNQGMEAVHTANTDTYAGAVDLAAEYLRRHPMTDVSLLIQEVPT